MTKYHIFSINKATGARDDLDWTYDYNEAVRWLDEFAADDAAEGYADCYDYEIVKEEEEEEEENTFTWWRF